MNIEEIEKNKINRFIELIGSEDEAVTSTGATVVNFSGTLYNVSGSTCDPKGIPKYKGVSWKKLLIRFGIDENSTCYITNPGAKNTHPEFSVGGHMTTFSNGSVPVGQSCYLMPECQWHNNTKRDGIEFYHTHTKMLLLSGYMQGELAATFQLRLPCCDAFGLLYNLDDEWRHGNFPTKEQAETFLKNVSNGDTIEYYLFERYIQNQRLKLVRIG